MKENILDLQCLYHSNVECLKNTPGYLFPERALLLVLALFVNPNYVYQDSANIECLLLQRVILIFKQLCLRLLADTYFVAHLK